MPRDPENQVATSSANKEPNPPEDYSKSFTREVVPVLQKFLP